MYKSFLVISALTALSALATHPAQAQSALPSAVLAGTGVADATPTDFSPTPASAQPWSLQASYDLGVLSFGGIGVHAGVSKGPWAASVGYYRFESKEMFGGALGGFGEDFKLLPLRLSIIERQAKGVIGEH